MDSNRSSIYNEHICYYCSTCICLFVLCVCGLGGGGIFDIEFYEYIIIFKSEKYQYWHDP